MLDNLEYHINQVLLFNKICGTEKRLEKERKAIIELYENLVQEEWDETVRAINTLDKVEFVDGLCDLCYVNIYLDYLSVGLPVEALILLEKLPPFTFTELVDKRNNSLRIDGYSFQRFSFDIMKTVEFYNRIFDMERAMNEVHKSNFSKFIDVTGMDVKSLEDLQKREAEWIYNSYKEQGKDLDCVACEVVETDGKQWLVFKNGNGKVLKASTFVSPNLKFVEICNA